MIYLLSKDGLPLQHWEIARVAMVGKEYQVVWTLSAHDSDSGLMLEGGEEIR